MIYINNQPIQTEDAAITKSISGDFILTFTTYDLPDNIAFHNIVEDGVIFANGYEFIVKQLQATKNKKTVVAPSIFYANADVFNDGIYGGTRTFSEFATHALKGTGWTFTTDFGAEKRIIPNFGEENTVKLVEQLCAAYECEYEILPGKKIKFAKELSADKGHIYRYGVNVKHLTRNIDSTNIKTRIKGFGADGLIVEYISPQEDKLGKRVAEPIHDDRYLHADSLRERLRMELQDYPLINFETDVVDLTTRELGETVTLVYEPMDNLVIKIRVIEQNYIYKRGKWRVDKVTLGNYKQQSNVDILVSTKLDLDDNKKHTTSRFEQTNDLIHMSVTELDGKIVENKAEWEMTATQIRSELWSVNEDLDGKITKANSRITQTAKEIRAEVSEVKLQGDKAIEENKSLISQTAREIRSEVNTVNKNAQDGILQANSKISQTATTIRSEINQVEKDLQKGITATNSKIEQTARSITSTVNENYNNLNNKITLNKQDADGNITRIDKAIIASNSKIEQTATSINSTVTTHYNDLNGKITNTNNRVSTAESRITQTASDITSEVRSNFTDLNGKINNTNSQIQIMTNAINLKVTKNEVTSMISVGVDDGISNATIQANQINFRGSVFGQDATFTGDLRAPRVVGTSGSSYGDVLMLGYSGARINYQGGSVRLANDGSNYVQVGSGYMTLYTGGSSQLGISNNTVTVYNDLTVNGKINGQKFTSKRELKKNIEPMKDNAIKKVMTTPIYKYNYTDDLDGELKYTGTIIDEAVSDIVNVDGETINIYSMLSVLWKAVQEQQQLIDRQQEQINTLLSAIKTN